jgi:hypothetical protein
MITLDGLVNLRIPNSAQLLVHHVFRSSEYGAWQLMDRSGKVLEQIADVKERSHACWSNDGMSIYKYDKHSIQKHGKDPQMWILNEQKVAGVAGLYHIGKDRLVVEAFDYVNNAEDDEEPDYCYCGTRLYEWDAVDNTIKKIWETRNSIRGISNDGMLLADKEKEKFIAYDLVHGKKVHECPRYPLAMSANGRWVVYSELSDKDGRYLTVSRDFQTAKRVMLEQDEYFHGIANNSALILKKLVKGRIELRIGGSLIYDKPRTDLSESAFSWDSQAWAGTDNSWAHFGYYGGCSIPANLFVHSAGSLKEFHGHYTSIQWRPVFSLGMLM